MERTRNEIFRPQINNLVEKNELKIEPLSFDRFYDKEFMIKLSRNWIKIMFKELFKK